jgi:hypothetical protein
MQEPLFDGLWFDARPHALAALRRTDGFGGFWTPQDMVRNHPAVSKVNILLKLDGDHFEVNLNHNAFQPITNAVAPTFVITKYINSITYLVDFFQVRHGLKMELCHKTLPN